MLNPLSLQIGQTCTGKEINNWCNYQINSNGSHYKDAVRLLGKHYCDDRVYCKSYKAETGHGEKNTVIEFCKICKLDDSFIGR